MTKITLNNLTTEQQESLRETFDKIKFKLSYGLDAESEEEAKQKLEACILAKLQSGKKLSSKEMQYLRQNNPVLYMQAVRVEQKRKALENQLEQAKSKEEVQKIATSALVSVREDDPAKQYVVAAIEETVKEFKESEKYKRLPETEEQAEEKDGKGRGSEKNEMVYEFGEQSYQVAYAEENSGVVYRSVLLSLRYCASNRQFPSVVRLSALSLPYR